MLLQKGLILLLSLILLSFSGKETVIKKGKDHAVFFAVKDYDHWQDLNTPIKDATAIASVLEDKYDFTTEIIKNPTWLEVMDKITLLQEQYYNSEDQLLIFFTGHGDFIPSAKDDKKGKGYFIPRDAKKNDKHYRSYLYYPNLKPEIDDIPCEHILIVIDACYSGSFLQYRTGGDERPGKMSERDKLITNTLKKRCRKGITSGGLKRTKDGVYHSPFTNRFLNALNHKSGEDRILTYNELFTELEGLNPAPHRGYFGVEDSDSKFLFIAKTKSSNPNQGIQSAKRQVDFDNWQKAEKEQTIQAYQKYLTLHPNGIFASKAENKIANIGDETDWNIATTLDTKLAYKDYLERHPYGKYNNNAKDKIKETKTQKFKTPTLTLIKGVATDNDGLALIGANILIKGTTIGTVTDIDGNFSMTNLPNFPFTLVISYIGFETKEIQITKDIPPLNIQLAEKKKRKLFRRKN